MADTHKNDNARISAEQQMQAYATEPFWEKVGHPAMDKLIADLNDAHDRIKLKLCEL